MKRLSAFIMLLIISSHLYSQVYNIQDYGAVADGKVLNTRAIQKAIDESFAAGGGTVYVPAGIFVTGTLNLKSNINLYLERGAVLKGSADIADYTPFERPGFGATNYGMLFTLKAENVSISGFGTLDGSEEAFFNWTKAKKIEWGGVQYTRQKDNFRHVTSGIGDGPVEPFPRRPHQMIIFSQCKNVTVENVVISKSPFWTLHMADCDGVTIKGVKIWNSLETPNCDGIDITSCSNVNVSDCDIRAGDDGIAITGYAFHYELPGYYNLRHISENINITNCHLQSRSSGLRVGYEDQNSVRNINVSNITITNSNRGIAICVRDSGSIENIKISQVHIETRLHTGDWWGNGEPIHISAIRSKKDGGLGQIRNLTFRDITCIGESGILLWGSPESVIEGLRFENIRFQLKNSALNEYAGGNIDLRGCYDQKQALFSADIPGFFAQFVQDLSIQDVTLLWDDIPYPFYTHGIEISDFANVNILNFKGSAAPHNKNAFPVHLKNGTGFLTDRDAQSVSKNNVK
jgi:hypothetical protein